MLPPGRPPQLRHAPGVHGQNEQERAVGGKAAVGCKQPVEGLEEVVPDGGTREAPVPVEAREDDGEPACTHRPEAVAVGRQPGMAGRRVALACRAARGGRRANTGARGTMVAGPRVHAGAAVPRGWA